MLDPIIRRLVTGWATLGATIETTIATAIVDGLSRLGLSENNGNMKHVMPDRYQWFRLSDEKNTNNGKYFDRLLNGHNIILPPAGVDEASLTKLRWRVTVAGLAYTADSTPYYLALLVLFLHALLALGQIVYMLLTRRSSQAWDNFEELLLLSQQSRQSTSKELQNTSGGKSNHDLHPILKSSHSCRHILCF